MIDSKKFRPEIENLRWATGEDKFYQKMCDFVVKTYGKDYEHSKKDKKRVKKYKGLKKDLEKIKSLSF